ncbi:kinase [Dulcicalothrix desertica PCC 7102]|uniref:Kinase n=1 Tax=Dulcicalothrix desertica PCC 7102 TaxID=232991 RepID=A0A3S1CAD1_9CYAN|nr:sugar kinase [Dulcicalothrix desertica]RUS98047.1 kinase [Dulcicalothrix desertica PCC 7102]TWH54533.1 sugar/nucleoside kinase (ribokinase family) [Dulcicalothrix desertica PCC 7102]
MGNNQYYGLFVGLITLDLIYLAQSPPQNNQKLVASDYTVAAGGPATNAAVAFSHLGGKAELVGVLGSHPMTQLIRTDLEKHKVTITDLEASFQNPPPVSSIIVTQTTGERAVISINALKTQVSPQAISKNLLEYLKYIDIILIDGHQIEVSYHIAQLAKARNIPVVIDGGSWKPGFEKILPFVDFAICSSNFHPPNCPTEQDTFAYLDQMGIPNIAITHGEQPISCMSEKEISTINVPSIQPTDTLGAGDIFHGAFCYYILQHSFAEAISYSAKVAARSCQSFGTRRWLE